MIFNSVLFVERSQVVYTENVGKLVSIVLLIFVIALFPPAVLAVVSNNAVPGDTTYPVKRGLEDIIFAVASLNPATRAWFAAARSDRRFQEVTVLVARGKKAGDTLNELVEQTQIAANQIDQVSDPAQKAKLINQLSESITKYDTGLSQISQTGKPAMIPTPQQPASVVQVVSSPAATPQFSQQPQPVAVRPQVSANPQLTVMPQNSPTPAPSAPASSPAPAVIGPGDNSGIDQARDALEKIKQKLETEGENQSFDKDSNRSDQGKNGQDQPEKKKDHSSNKGGKS